MTTNISANHQTSSSNSNTSRLSPRPKFSPYYLVEHQNIEKYRSKQKKYFRKSIKVSLFLFVLLSVAAIFFDVHIYIYNQLLYGPFHLDRKGFIEHVDNYKNGQSWFRRIEYIQVELGENPIQSPRSHYDIIRKYSDITTRHTHIATYKKMTNPSIYIKSPTPSHRSFRKRFPFIFESFSQTTIECIIRILQTNEGANETVLEKSKYLTYINDQYSKNATLFNKLILTRCGILIGYLYSPKYDKAFIRDREYKFYSDDIALDITSPYCSLFFLIIFCIIFMCVFIDWLFYFSLYVSWVIRLTLYKKFNLSFSLEFEADTIEELWLLNIDGSPYEQLLYFDELIRQTCHRFQNELFIVENSSKELFVVMIRQTLANKPSDVNDQLSPFIVCPVTDIIKLDFNGIFYSDKLSFIPWPFISFIEYNHAEWLHTTLMEISEFYRNRYENRIANTNGIYYRSVDNSTRTPTRSGTVSNNNEPRRRRTQPAAVTGDNELRKLIIEEENIQRFKRERQHILETIFNPSRPASPEFIARFRMQQKAKNCLIDSSMANEHISCIICLEELKLNESYSQWPCSSKVPHIFHQDCMLNTLRTSNACPICRHTI